MMGADESSAGPVAIVCAVLISVAVVFAAPFLALGIAIADGGVEPSSSGLTGVPDEYLSDVQRAGSICAEVTPQIIAAQLDAESGWNPTATSPAGAQGIAQFMPGTWEAHGMDGDGDGKADVLNAHDAIWSQGNYMCRLVDEVKALKAGGKVSGDVTELALAAYNAGLGAVRDHGGIPPYQETQRYVERIIEWARTKYTMSGGGMAVGQLSPKLVMLNDTQIDIAAMNIAATWYGGPSGYAYKQCTWWAASRRQNIGRPVDAHMGNGGYWVESARRLGYQYGKDPQPGDVMTIRPGTLGSDAAYGHVAVVEQVDADGGIVISESGSSLPAPILTRYSRGQLDAVRDRIWFIH